ncbi:MULTISPECIES: entericidin A/B family lipoprotein [Salinicola]|uniref:Entericidin A/B family lipoprotein n=1 Tax=Salinicola endophyticus TaxID=1949083 RepID=A0AB74UEC4_9GAMM|nr:MULTISPECIES: entericidin A/B family lipoprotein [Salinicola]KFF48044.1 entericidin [Gammaproteobacteria bacterium MFB021]MCE3028516.1 entericidin A/B family lipoprotein [Salinicola sp. DM10]WFF40710.1 entericidin A/B family lipoprotein [Salinicola endophyticus]WIX33383.1 entericidin A/B family lipoprotein [Salinicola sp. JS01]
MKRLIALSLLALLGAGILSGCNTVSGAGQDIEEGGEAVQDAAN